MKATLHFDLATPEDTYSHRLAMAAPELVAALWGIENRLRSQLKYGELSEATRTELETLRELVPRAVLDGLSE